MIQFEKSHAIVQKIKPKDWQHKKDRSKKIRVVELEIMVPNCTVDVLGNAMGTGCNPTTVFWDGKGQKRTDAITGYKLGMAIFEQAHRLSFDFTGKNEAPKVVEDVEKVWNLVVEPTNGHKFALTFNCIIHEPSRRTHTLEKLHAALNDAVRMTLAIRVHEADLLSGTEGVKTDKSADKKAAKD